MLALESEFNCSLRSRCSMEMWCPDDIGRDSWDWFGPACLGESMLQLPEWGGGSSPVKTEPLQIVLLLLLVVCSVWCVVCCCCGVLLWWLLWWSVVASIAFNSLARTLEMLKTSDVIPEPSKNARTRSTSTVHHPPHAAVISVLTFSIPSHTKSPCL